MPRKSSKTAHVMNLIAGDGGIKETETTAKQEESRKKAVEHEPEPISPEPGAEISDTSAEAIDPVAEMIKIKLEEELEQTVRETETKGEKQQTAAEAATEPEVTEEPKAVTEPEVKEGPKAVTEPEMKEEPKTDPEKSLAEVEPEVKAEAPQAEPEPKAVEEPSYQYVNVMEKIVEDEVLYFMREFKMCMCDRCIADTKALALTRMPAKYIVKEKSQIPPLMNFYANKFIGYVTVELTKACTIVKEIPHHDR